MFRSRGGGADGSDAGRQIRFSFRYMTPKSLAVYDIASQKLSYVDLPKEAKGPVQIYPSPDSKYVYVADQGYYFNQPKSDLVYKIRFRGDESGPNYQRRNGSARRGGFTRRKNLSM